MRRIGFIILSLLLPMLLQAQQTPAQRYIEQVAAQEPFRSSALGVLAVRANGDTLASFASGAKLVPASNMKLLTTGLALDNLGPGYRYETVLASDGAVRDSVLAGNLYLIGEGDPSLGVEMGAKDPELRTFRQWQAILETAGVARIAGNIIADRRYFPSEGVLGDWMVEDLESEDAVAAAGVSFRHNYRDTTYAGGAERSGAANLAHYFREYLAAGGIAVDGETGDEADFAELLAPEDSLRSLGKTYSEPLRALVSHTNHRSDNLFAETLFRTLGMELRETDEYGACAALETALLEAMGLDVSQVRVRDGSGLSRKNYVSPGFLVDFLLRMAGRPVFDAYVRSLPQPGAGTLAARMRTAPASVKSRIYMKSGSMDGIRCFSGYVLPENGRPEDVIAFSVMTNNNTAPSGTVLPILDRIILLIAE